MSKQSKEKSLKTRVKSLLENLRGRQRVRHIILQRNERVVPNHLVIFVLLEFSL